MSKVLLINDSRFESLIMKDILNTMGYTVKISDEYGAVSQVKDYCPDYLIVNYVMKEIRGDQLIALIKMDNSKVKCILTSCNTIDIKQFNSKFIDAVFQTPIDKFGMERVLNSLNEKSSNKGNEISCRAQKEYVLIHEQGGANKDALHEDEDYQEKLLWNMIK